MTQNGIVGVARHVEHPRVRSLVEHGVGEKPSADTRHDHVGQQQVDRAVVLLQQGKRRRGIPRGQHRVTVGPQHPLGQGTHRIVVLRQ